MIVKHTRSNQMIIMWLSLIGIFVAKMQGTSAEKKMIADIEATPITNFNTIESESATAVAGKNISAIPMAEALPANRGSGSRTSQATG